MNDQNSTNNTNELSIPGFGMAGNVMCPKMSITHPSSCCKSGCEHWVELKCGDRTVGRCADAWSVVLLTELRMEVERLRTALSEVKK